MSAISPVTLQGWVATQPSIVTTKSGKEVIRFRLAVTPRRYDAVLQTWSDGTTVWFTVLAYRADLVRNVSKSVLKGQPVVVHGRMSSVEWTDDKNTTRLDLQVVAESIGHDLSWGQANFVRVYSGKNASIPDADPSSELPAEPAPSASVLDSDVGSSDEAPDDQPVRALAAVGTASGGEEPPF